MCSLQTSTDATLTGAALVTAAGTVRRSLYLRAGMIDGCASARAIRIDLRGHLIFPGLINAHEHLQVNNVPPLPADTTFPNSYAWIEAFRRRFAEPALVAALAEPKERRLRHGALKNLLAGVTCVAHHDPWHPALDARDFPVTLLRNHGWSYTLNGPDYGPPVQLSFATTPSTHPWMIHLAEGTDDVAAAELDQLDGLGCLAANTVLIHGVGMGKRDIERVIAAGAAVVWCPGSNRRLLGTTLDPRRLHAAGRLAIGSDSRLSGERDLLVELRNESLHGELGPTALLTLATVASARILRLASRGRLDVGGVGDLVIVADRGGHEVNGLIGRDRSDIRAVVRDGIPRVADPDFADWFAAAGVETVAVTLDGKPKLLARELADPDVLALEPGLERVLPIAAGSRSRAGQPQ